MTLSQDLFTENNKEKDKITSKWLIKQECYKTPNGNSIELRIWSKYH